MKEFSLDDLKNLLNKALKIFLKIFDFFYKNFGVEGLGILVFIFINLISFFYFKIPSFLKILGILSNLILIFFIYDISEKNLKRRIEAQKSQNMILNVFELLPYGMIIYDEYFTVIQVNKKMCEIVGLSKEEIVGQKVKPEMLKSAKFKILAQILFPSLSGQIISRKQEGKVEITEVFFSEPTESYFTLWTLPVFEEKKTVTKLKIVQDKTAEVLYQKNQNEFYSIAAHQLKTPLSEINWIIEALKNPLTDSEKENLIESGLRIVKKTIWLVETILNSVKLESGKIALNIEKIKINDLVEEVIDLFKKEIEINNINVIKNFKVNLEIPGDKSKLFLALANIIDNAIRYNKPSGSIEINIEQLHDYLSISVKDSGLGIPKKEQEYLFQRFFRASNVRKIGKEGFGLGLYLTKKVIDLHGGKINIESEENKGTKITITLPLQESLIP